MNTEVNTELVDRKPSYAEAKRDIARRRCLRHPDKGLVVGLRDGAYVPQCNECRREGLEPLIGEAPSKTLERSKRMVETAIAKRGQGLQSLSLQEVRTLLPVGKANDNEIRVFIRYCQAVGADPWAKEVYLVKYQENAVAAIVLALNWYLKRASHNPAYESYESGVIVKRQGKYIDVVGSVVWEGDTLFGGWCKVYKTGARRPFERRVTMAEYDRHQFGWKTMPATMIEKVAIVQGIRRAFPDEFTGFAEKGELPVVLEGEVEELPAAAAISDAQEGPQDEQEPAPESGGVPQTGGAGFTGTTIVELLNYGLRLGFKGKEAILAALNVKDTALIGDLQEAAKMLEAARP